MNQLQVFNYNSAELRTITKDGESWWVLKDVCDVLDIANSGNVAARLDDDEKDIHTMDTPGGEQRLTITSESGLYSVIMLSRKPEAKEFKRWVTHEVLPSIRKHGGYLTPEKIEDVLSDPDTLIRLATDLKAERERRKLIEVKAETLAVKLEESEKWLSVKRVAKLNGISWRKISWRKLKDTSEYLQIDTKKVFDANYGEVNAYHLNVWQHEYPEYQYKA